MFSKYAAKGGPHKYDRDSQSFKRGAWRFWDRNTTNLFRKQLGLPPL